MRVLLPEDQESLRLSKKRAVIVLRRMRHPHRPIAIRESVTRSIGHESAQ